MSRSRRRRRRKRTVTEMLQHDSLAGAFFCRACWPSAVGGVLPLADVQHLRLSVSLPRRRPCRRALALSRRHRHRHLANLNGVGDCIVVCAGARISSTSTLTRCLYYAILCRTSSPLLPLHRLRLRTPSDFTARCGSAVEHRPYRGASVLMSVCASTLVCTRACFWLL